MRRIQFRCSITGCWVGLPVLAAAVLSSSASATAQGVPVEVAKLVASDRAPGDWFSGQIAASGEYVFIGAPGDDAGRGAVYIFRRDSGGQWSEFDKISASDGAGGDQFGASFAIDGSRLIVGAPGVDGPGDCTGAAYIFGDAGGGSWTEVAKLTASDGETGDQFGGAVAILGDTAVIGANGDDGRGEDAGAAYIFRDAGGGNWVEVSKITASDGAARDRFGSSVALSNGTAIVGAWGHDAGNVDTGAAYVFQDQGGGNWSQSAKLVASDPAFKARFGWSVAVAESTAVIGASQDDDNGEQSGSAYVFGEDGGIWTQQAKLLPSSGGPFEWFGRSVATDGELIVVGAPGGPNPGENVGSGWAFRSNAQGNWDQLGGRITASDGGPEHHFGDAVAVAGNTLFIGTPRIDGNTGAVYVFAVVAHLTATLTCPSGGPIRIEWSGATPGGQVALIFARNTGSFIIPNNMPCAGTQLGLGSNQIQLAWQGGAGPNGSRTLNATAGPGACGGHLQLLDFTPCATSNVVPIE